MGPASDDLVSVRLGGRRYDLRVSPRVFVPNVTTMLFARLVEVRPEDTVLDIGCGVAPLSIWAALEGAAMVHAVDPVQEHVELARANRDAYGLTEKIDVLRGECFEPVAGVRADVIMADVSGIAGDAARALGWYPDAVPTGGTDGTEVIAEIIANAHEHLKPDGVLYFAVADGLSDHQRVMRLARRTFASLAPASREFKVPLPESGMEALRRAYGGSPPPFISPVEIGDRYFWTGRLWRAAARPDAF